jgi:RimJ/RimL family protein N-acetyltransferase
MNATITIAPFNRAQLDAVWQLRLRALHDHPESFGQPWATAVEMSPGEVRNLASTFWTGGDNEVFIATTPEGNPVGMLGIFRESRPREQHRMQLWGVYVDPDYRSLGLATRLAGAAFDYASTLPGVLQIHLTVWSNNHAAIASYTRLGFQRWGTMPRADIIDGEAIDYDHMVLMLDQSSSTKT